MSNSNNPKTDFIPRQSDLPLWNPEKSGFRLKRMEIYNWGTFHERIWIIPLDGNLALLTGANGSGKSTIVDGILTLLVPPRKRNYNLSSGSEKRERTEKSYIMGVYGNIRNADSLSSTTQVLRDGQEYSVLLAVFQNERTGENLTLAQFFWREQEGERKFFVCAQTDLSIREHFAGHASPHECKKALKKREGVEIYSSFNDYASHFRKVMDLRSPKALDLFNQIVAIKEVGRLNQFIREHMLDAPSTEDMLQNLYLNFHNLNLSYQAIVKAKEQLTALSPLVKLGLDLVELERKEKEQENTRESLPAYFANKELSLLEKETKVVGEKLAKGQTELSLLKDERERLETKRESLEFNINQDQTGQEIRRLEEKNRHLRENLETKKKNEGRYLELANQLKLPAADSPEVFLSSLEEARGRKGKIEAEIEVLQENLFVLRQKSEKLIQEKDLVQSELISLKGRKNQIPFPSIEMRRNLLGVLGTGEKEMPFIGELIKVREDQSHWEGAIERLLNSFGLRLLVPETLYQKMNAYLHQNHLKAKVVYHRVRREDLHEKILNRDSREIREIRDIREIRERIGGLDEDHLFHKLEFNIQSPYLPWVQKAILDHFDFICTDDLDRFRMEARAITSSGLAKKGSTLHEKDDRFSVRDRTRYILGWDNREKMAHLEKILANLEKELKKGEAEDRKARQEKENYESLKFILHDFSQFTSYTDIFWQPEFHEAAQNEKTMVLLLQRDKHLQELKGGLETTKVAILENLEKRDIRNKEISLLQNHLESFVRRGEAARKTLVPYLAAGLPDDYKIFTLPLEEKTKKIVEALPGRILTLENLAGIEREIRNWLHKTKEKLLERKRSLEGQLIGHMGEFIRRFPEEGKNLSSRPEYFRDFFNFKNKIEAEALPQYEERFRQLLNKSVVSDMTSFKSTLETAEEEIKESIDHLNQSLSRILYSPSTFIQLETTRTNDLEIREFQNLLRDSFPDLGFGDDVKVYEESFHKIREIIKRLQEEERWRKKVTDVRNWQDYAAIELTRETKSQVRYYSDSAGLSGGQKAKLAFTILASGVAYQYGLHLPETFHKSFRFVVIDEAFSKSDEANSQYAMELFKTLGLQLMVVTPLDKIHVVEPYLNRIHFVHNNEAKNYSQIKILTMEEFREIKETKELNLWKGSNKENSKEEILWPSS